MTHTIVIHQSPPPQPDPQTTGEAHFASRQSHDLGISLRRLCHVMVSQSHKGDRRSNFQGRHSKLAKQCPDLNLYIYYFLDRSLHRRNLVFGAEWLSDGFDVLLVVFRQKEEASLETSTRVRTMHIALGVGNSICTIFFKEIVYVQLQACTIVEVMSLDKTN